MVRCLIDTLKKQHFSRLRPADFAHDATRLTMKGYFSFRLFFISTLYLIIRHLFAARKDALKYHFVFSMATRA